MQGDMMPIQLLSKEKVEKEDPINMELNLNKSLKEEDKRMEEAYELEERSKNNGGSKKNIREKIIDFMKSQGYSYAQGRQEFDDETSDLFGKGDILIEVAITIDIDNEVVKQMIN